MRLVYYDVDVPKLAWCAVVERDKSHVHVYHGNVRPSAISLWKGVEQSLPQVSSSSDFFIGTSGKLPKFNQGGSTVCYSFTS